MSGQQFAILHCSPDSQSEEWQERQRAAQEHQLICKGFEELQQCEQVLEKMQYLQELCALHHLRACMLHSLGRGPERNCSARQFVEAQRMLQSRARTPPPTTMSGGPDDALRLVCEELKCLEGRGVSAKS